MKKLLVLLLGICCIGTACKLQQKPDPTCMLLAHEKATADTVRAWAAHFFERYAARDDWQGFLDLYEDSLQFKDVILRMNLESKSEFAAFYDWPNPSFAKHPDYPETLVIEDLLVDGYSAIGIGRLTPFYWQRVLYEVKNNGRFQMYLKFNEKGKIIEHVDWIEYPGSILETVGKRLQEEDKQE